MFAAIKKFFLKLFGIKENDSEIGSDPGIPEAPSNPPVADDSGIPEILIGEIIAKDKAEREMVIAAIVHVRDVVYSQQFADEVMTTKFTNTKGLTNAEILKKFISTTLTVHVSMYTGSFVDNRINKTWGYDNDDKFVHANRYFVNNAIDLGSLILHELAHYLGFSHATAREHTSVPYSMNDIFYRVAEELGIT